MRYVRDLNLPQQSASLWQKGLLVLGGVLLATGMTLATQSSVRAQAAYGSYLGVGVGFGVTEGGAGEPDDTGGLIAVRYKFLKAPVSLRTQVLIGDNIAVVPTISYDVPLGWNADVYLGVGASIVTGSETSPVGNETAFAIQPGIDYALPNSRLVLFGNAIIAFDAYENVDERAAVSIQGGVGLRF